MNTQFLKNMDSSDSFSDVIFAFFTKQTFVNSGKDLQLVVKCSKTHSSIFRNSLDSSKRTSESLLYGSSCLKTMQLIFLTLILEEKGFSAMQFSMMKAFP